MRQIRLWTLIGQTPVPVENPLNWAVTANNRVAETRIGPFRVSTIFLGLHTNMVGPPQLFETMVFSQTPEDEDEQPRSQVRYATWIEAEAGHRQIVDELHRHYPNEKVIEATPEEV